MRDTAVNALSVGGLASVLYGVWMFTQPGAIVAGGLAAIGLAVILHRSKR